MLKETLIAGFGALLIWTGYRMKPESQEQAEADIWVEGEPILDTSVKEISWGGNALFFDNTITIAKQKANALIRSREGVHNPVSADSLGKLTAGIGHLVTPADNLKKGQVLSNAEIERLYKPDFNKAFNAGLSQAKELGKSKDADFIASLASVNFQLGTGWRNKFKNTWALLKAGQSTRAIRNINSSLWAKQTPVRTRDFTQAINKAFTTPV